MQKQSVTTCSLMPSLVETSCGRTPPSFTSECHIIWCEMCLRSVWGSCPSCPLSQSFPQPQPAHMGSRVRNGEDLGTVQAQQ